MKKSKVGGFLQYYFKIYSKKNYGIGKTVDSPWSLAQLVECLPEFKHQYHNNDNNNNNNKSTKHSKYISGTE
jgi:hypothetical protein